MAGDWIKMRSNLWDDPRVARLCDLTDQSEAAVVGALYWLWATADQHTVSGVMPGLTLRQIDRKTGVTGIGEALCSIGWLADHQEGVRVVNFSDHNGASAKRRALDAQRKASIRSVSACDADKIRNERGQNAPDCGARVRVRERVREEENTVAENANAHSAIGDQNDDENGSQSASACPHQKIIDLYHQIIPVGRKVRAWPTNRSRLLQARWRENPKHQTLEFWERLFTHITDSDFLMGRVNGHDRPPFQISLDFIVTQGRFYDIIEGKYHREARG